MHPWAAARPLAVRAASFARRVVSKPGQAPPPPTGTAAWPRGGLPSVGACCLCPTCPGSAATHRHRDQAPHPAITHTIPAPTPNFACNSPTTVSNLESTTLELQRFLGISKSDRIKLRATFVGVERRRWGANGGAPTAGKLGTAAGRDPVGSRPVSRAARLTRGRSYCPRRRWLLPALSVSLAYSCAVVGEAASRTPSATASEIVGETTLAPTRAVNIC